MADRRAETDTEELISRVKSYYAAHDAGNAGLAGNEKRRIELFLRNHAPFLYEDIVLAVYGTGRISHWLLCFFDQFASDRKASLVFLHTEKATGRRFKGFEVFNIKDITIAAPDVIVIGSIQNADEIKSEISKAGYSGVPQIELSERINTLVELYEEHEGLVRKAPEVILTERMLQDDIEPFFVEGISWQTKVVLKSFPEIRRKVIGVIAPGYSEKTYYNIPILQEFPQKGTVKPLKTVLNEYLGLQKYVEYTPVSIRLDASTICQLNCTGCYMRLNNYGTMGRGYVRCENVRRLLLENPGIRTMELSNSGEPFCNPEMLSILELLHERGVLIQLWNGVNLNDVSDDILDALVRFDTDTITISIDGVTQETYGKYRRNGKIEKVFANIEKINRLKKIYHKSRPVLRWQYILMNHNQHEITLAVKKARELKMEIVFKPDWRGGFIPKDAEKIAAVTGLKTGDQNQYTIAEGHVFESDVMCSQMILSPQINWDGRLLGCCSVYKNDWGINVFETPLREIFNDPNYRAAVRSLLSGRDGMNHTGPCRECYTYLENVINRFYAL